MKALKILFGLIFGAWAIGSLVLGLENDWAQMDLSARGLSTIGSLVAVVGIFALFSVWSFQSAFRKPAFPAEDDVPVGITNNGQPQSPPSADQPAADG
jgi:hypothetical protein